MVKEGKYLGWIERNFGAKSEDFGREFKSGKRIKSVAWDRGRKKLVIFGKRLLRKREG